MTNNWDGLSLEELVIESIKATGSIKHLLPLLSILSEEKKAHYRVLVQKLLKEKKEQQCTLETTMSDVNTHNARN
jgi:hypothetical protein